MVTDVGAPLFANVAVPLGTVFGGIEVQFVPTVHSAPGPVQVPSTAYAAFGANIASAPRQTLPSSAARLKATRAAGGAIRIAVSRIAARGAAGAAACGVCGRHPYDRIPEPLPTE